jgi:hypothetical protein
MYAALEFDHALFKPQIQWIVVACSAVGHKCGGPVALPPRHDVAYFVNPVTARKDAEAFADFKNRQAEGHLDESEKALAQAATQGATPKRHLAYPWDHQLMATQPLRWGVLEWSGNEEIEAPRIDVAYFTDPETAEGDARLFAMMRG